MPMAESRVLEVLLFFSRCLVWVDVCLQHPHCRSTAPHWGCWTSGWGVVSQIGEKGLSFLLFVVSSADWAWLPRKEAGTLIIQWSKVTLAFTKGAPWAPSASWLVCSDTREKLASGKAQGGCGNQKSGQLEVSCVTLDNAHDLNVH